MNLAVSPSRLAERRGLLRGLDRIHRRLDAARGFAGLNVFEQQAADLILGSSKQAFDLAREDASTRARYGPGLGEQLLVARRLCEAGCGFVSLNYGWAPQPADTPFAWDMHLGPSQPKAPPMRGQLEKIFPMLDHAVAAFLQDVAERGVADKILLVVTGDFGRTPKINQYGGRDHWPGLCTLALAGGGLKCGQVVGTSSTKAELPTSQPVSPGDLMATILHVLGIPGDLHFRDFAGRPQALLPATAQPIPALV